MWTTNGTQADWMCLLANTSEGAPHKNKSLICLPMKTKGVEIARKLDKLGMRSSDTAQIFFDNVRVPQRYPDRRGGQGLHLPDDAIPGGAAVGGGRRSEIDGALIEADHRLYPQPQSLRQDDPRQSGGAFPAGRARNRDRAPALAGLSRLRALSRGQRRHAAGVDGQAQGRAACAAKCRRLPAILGRHGLHEREPDQPRLPRRPSGFDRRRRRRESC